FKEKPEISLLSWDESTVKRLELQKEKMVKM
ncbi:MAG: hypothetical protein ACI9RM_002536, partial [Ulvibacter sp.]